MTEREAYVAFNLTGQIGSVKVSALAERAGGVAAAWAAYPSKEARAGGTVDVDAELRKARRYGASIVTPADASYPKALLAVRGHPLALYAMGDISALSKSAIAIVGTRRPTAYGLSIAHNLSADLAADGWAIVSGLALGIDAEAHMGALDAGGVTIGVLGSALDRFYPEENKILGRRIVDRGGAVISEFPFGRGPDQQTFPQRNHVVAGLCAGVIAVEAPYKSGTLITAGLAADMGRTVMAVPGRIDSPASAGCHALIRQGARLVCSAKDVAYEMGELMPAAGPGRGGAENPPADGGAGGAATLPPPPYSLEESIVMRNIDETPVSMDRLAAKTKFSAAKLNVLCMALRMKGRLVFLPGNRVAAPRSE